MHARIDRSRRKIATSNRIRVDPTNVSLLVAVLLPRQAPPTGSRGHFGESRRGGKLEEKRHHTIIERTARRLGSTVDSVVARVDPLAVLRRTAQESKANLGPWDCSPKNTPSTRRVRPINRPTQWKTSSCRSSTVKSPPCSSLQSPHHHHQRREQLQRMHGGSTSRTSFSDPRFPWCPSASASAWPCWGTRGRTRAWWGCWGARPRGIGLRSSSSRTHLRQCLEEVQI